MTDDIEEARNLKFVLYFFQSVSGQKIKIQKSEVIIVLNDETKNTGICRDVQMSEREMAH